MRHVSSQRSNHWAPHHGGIAGNGFSSCLTRPNQHKSRNTSSLRRWAGLRVSLAHGWWILTCFARHVFNGVNLCIEIITIWHRHIQVIFEGKGGHNSKAENDLYLKVTFSSAWARGISFSHSLPFSPQQVALQENQALSLLTGVHWLENGPMSLLQCYGLCHNTLLSACWRQRLLLSLCVSLALWPELASCMWETWSGGSPKLKAVVGHFSVSSFECNSLT
jgi:hypothetical protein